MEKELEKTAEHQSTVQAWPQGDGGREERLGQASQTAIQSEEVWAELLGVDLGDLGLLGLWEPEWAIRGVPGLLGCVCLRIPDHTQSLVLEQPMGAWTLCKRGGRFQSTDGFQGVA